MRTLIKIYKGFWLRKVAEYKAKDFDEAMKIFAEENPTAKIEVFKHYMVDGKSVSYSQHQIE